MDSPIFLCPDEQTWMQNCHKQFAPEYYRRFVDDMFILFKDKGHMNKFGNSRHQNMKLRMIIIA